MNKDKTIFENKHGSDDFNFDVVYNNSSEYCNNIGNFVYCHWHHGFELIYVTQGSMVMEIDTIPFQVQEGDVLIINKDEIHSGYCVNNTSCSFFAIIFNPEMLNSDKPDICQKKYIEPVLRGELKFKSLISRTFKWNPGIIRQLKEIIDCYEIKKFGFELKIKSCISGIIADAIMNNFLIENSGVLKIKQEKIHMLKNVIKYIEENYKEKIHINELASIAGISADHFFKCFKNIIGESPVTYINRYRIIKACILLQESDLSILEIAVLSGFDDSSYFIKVFKKFKHMPPSEFRKIS